MAIAFNIPKNEVKEVSDKDNELTTMVTQWKQRPFDKEFNTKLMNKLTPVIDSALKTYGYKDDPIVATEAKLYTLKVLNKYDPAKGAGIKTFLVNELRRLPRIAARYQFAIPLPDQAVLDSRHLEEARQKLIDKYNREPTIDELADETGLSKKRIDTLQKYYNRPVVISTSEQGVPVEPTITDQEKLWLDAVYQSLNDIDKKIFEWTLGWNGQPVKSKKEIATLLNITPAAVTQRSSRISQKIMEGEALK